MTGEGRREDYLDPKGLKASSEKTKLNSEKEKKFFL